MSLINTRWQLGSILPTLPTHWGLARAQNGPLSSEGAACKEAPAPQLVGGPSSGHLRATLGRPSGPVGLALSWARAALVLNSDLAPESGGWRLETVGGFAWSAGGGGSLVIEMRRVRVCGRRACVRRRLGLAAHCTPQAAYYTAQNTQCTMHTPDERELSRRQDFQVAHFTRPQLATSLSNWAPIGRLSARKLAPKWRARACRPRPDLSPSFVDPSTELPAPNRRRPPACPPSPLSPLAACPPTALRWRLVNFCPLPPPRRLLCQFIRRRRSRTHSFLLFSGPSSHSSRPLSWPPICSSSRPTFQPRESPPSWPNSPS